MSQPAALAGEAIGVTNVTATQTSSPDRQYIGVAQSHTAQVTYSAPGGSINGATIRIQGDANLLSRMNMSQSPTGQQPVITNDGSTITMDLYLGSLATGSQFLVPFDVTFKDHQDLATGGNVDKATTLKLSVLDRDQNLVAQSDYHVTAMARPVQPPIEVSSVQINSNQTTFAPGNATDPAVFSWNEVTNEYVSPLTLGLNISARYNQAAITGVAAEYAIANPQSSYAQLIVPTGFSITSAGWVLVDAATNTYAYNRPLTSNGQTIGATLTNNLNDKGQLTKVDFIGQTADQMESDARANAATPTLTRQLNYLPLSDTRRASVYLSNTEYVVLPSGQRILTDELSPTTYLGAQGESTVTIRSNNPDPEALTEIYSVTISRQDRADATNDLFLQNMRLTMSTGTNRPTVYGVDANGTLTAISDLTKIDPNQYVAIKAVFDTPLLINRSQAASFTLRSDVSQDVTLEDLLVSQHNYSVELEFNNGTERQIAKSSSAYLTWKALAADSVYQDIRVDNANPYLQDQVLVSRNIGQSQAQISANPFTPGVDYGNIQYKTTLPKGVVMVSSSRAYTMVENADGSTTYIYDITDNNSQAQSQINNIREMIAFTIEAFEGKPVNQTTVALPITSEVLYDKTAFNTTPNDRYVDTEIVELRMIKGLFVTTAVKDGTQYENSKDNLLPGETYQVRSIIANINETEVTEMAAIVTLPRDGDQLPDASGSRGSTTNAYLTGPVTSPDPRFDVFYSVQAQADGQQADTISGFVGADQIRDWSQVQAIRYVLKEGQVVKPSEFVYLNFDLQTDRKADPGDKMVVDTSLLTDKGVLVLGNPVEVTLTQPTHTITVNEYLWIPESSQKQPVNGSYDYSIKVTYADGKVETYSQADMGRRRIDLNPTTFAAIKSIELLSPTYRQDPSLAVNVTTTGDLLAYTSTQTLHQSFAIELETRIPQAAKIGLELYLRQEDGTLVQVPNELAYQMMYQVNMLNSYTRRSGYPYYLDSVIANIEPSYIQSLLANGSSLDSINRQIQGSTRVSDPLTGQPLYHGYYDQDSQTVRRSDNGQIYQISDLPTYHTSNAVFGYTTFGRLSQQIGPERMSEFLAALGLSSLDQLLTDPDDTQIPLRLVGYAPGSDPIAGRLSPDPTLVKLIVETKPALPLMVYVIDEEGKQLTLDLIKDQPRIMYTAINFKDSPYVGELVKVEGSPYTYQGIHDRQQFVAANGDVYEYVLSYSGLNLRSVKGEDIQPLVEKYQAVFEPVIYAMFDQNYENDTVNLYQGMGYNQQYLSPGNYPKMLT